MITCPVCENQQPHGGECEVCGRRLDGPPPPVAPVAPMDGLEPTRAAPVDVDGERFPDLEPTRAGDVFVAAERVPDLEATAAAPVTVAAELLPDLERTAEAPIPGDAPTALPAVVVCRYCRTPATGGERLCGRCGMRLPVSSAGAPAAAPAAERICSCGLPVRGSRCPSCGARTGA